MVVKAEAIYEGGIYELAKNNQTGYYWTKVKALKRSPTTAEKYSYYPVMLRITDDAGNVTIKTVSDTEIGEDLILIVREEQLFPLVYTVANDLGEELGYVKDADLIDLEIGETNDFELDLSADAWTEEMYNWGYRLFIPGTEYGGLLEQRKTSTSSNTVTWIGHTWRGLLSQKIIQPPTGQSHLTVSGEANNIIGQVLGDRFGPLFVASAEDSGIEISTYQFDRYCTLLDGLEKMLSSAGAKLKISYEQGTPGNLDAVVRLSAVPVVDWSEQLEYSQDGGKIKFATDDYRRGINHLICAGSGEEEERTVLHLYVQEDGSIGDEQYYFGLEEREALYSYTSAQDIDKLREDGIKRLTELMNYTEMTATLDDVDVDIGDIVGGRDRITGMSLRQPVIGKVLRTKNGETTIEYKLKGED